MLPFNSCWLLILHGSGTERFVFGSILRLTSQRKHYPELVVGLHKQLTISDVDSRKQVT